MKTVVVLLIGMLLLAGCQLSPTPSPPDPETELIDRGRQIFFNETFAGNGRTCGTCHPAENNFAIDPAFIASLPKDDPLFVAEFNAALKENFENPRLMREFGLIVENLDGFDDLADKFTLRGVPHTLGLRFSIDSPQGPRTGWSGDGSPGDGTLRSFAIGAVIQHFTKTLSRVPGVDFRLPTDDELDALEAFQFSLGRQTEITLPLPLKGTVAKRGQELFLSQTEGKCFACHFNAGANGSPAIFGANPGNLNFNTGVEDLPDQPQDLTGEKVPPDDGLGIPGDGTFNTPSVIEAADTGPFFHNNSIETIEGAVAFYNGNAFNNSPAGQLLQQATGSGINLDGDQVVEVAAFLRVINALENIRQSIELLEPIAKKRQLTAPETGRRLKQAIAENRDAIQVLAGAGLHPDAVLVLKTALKAALKAKRAVLFKSKHAKDAIRHQEQARDQLVERT